MIKIMLIITRLDRGGSAEATMQLAEGLAQKGYGVTLVTGKTVDPHEDIEWFQKRSGVPVIVVEAMRRNVSPLYDVLAFMAMRRLIILKQPDIVHTHSSKAGILGRAAAYAAGCRCIIHSPHGHIFYGYFGRMLTTIFIGMERMIARITDRILTLTDLEREDHITRQIKPKGGFSTVPCGIDPERFTQRKRPVEEVKEELGIPSGATVIGWVGRFVPIKGPEVFIEVVAELRKQRPEVMGLMVGDGERRRDAQRYAKRLGIEEGMIFTGMRDDIPDLMGIMGLFVLTSFNEGLGRVIIEAMSAGVPVVATRVGGVPEIIGEEDTGLLVPPGDPCSTVHAILRILEESEFAGRLAKAGRRRAERFSVTRMIDETEKVYKEVIRRIQVA